ncbi:TRAP transporter permease [Deinococcus yavapaiensis]|uniref:TRAP transporter 4TM/12TM fusion protein n=1 Tax=Deinococcus yavapaiensis KR-236 TaxID=694435 RepID=A0A318SDG8_9DEIO|nr:TRAP transporter permease [Deinococcus yavapaiensis]PYE54499.1 TRAP transporter 4TM/12TM fusion protein [Deinococcus yavapaiensis KR-236]
MTVSNSASDAGEARAQEIMESVELGGRKVVGWQRTLIGVVAVAWSLWQLYMAYVGNVDTFLQRASHLAFAFALVFLVYPFKKSQKAYIPWFDWLLGLAAVASVGWILVQYASIATVQGGVLTPTDVIFGSVTVVLLLIAGWRALGPAMSIVALVFILYTLTGPRGLIEADLGRLLQLHAGLNWAQLIGQLYANTEGIFGSPIAVSAQIVFLFVLFGAMFDRMGAGDWFMQVAQALLGSFRGGPAKASVVSSALNGIVSGSSVSNVVTGGNITIGTMKRVGYTAEKAGGIEVASSSNGQLMPPVMGAAAFIMAENLQIPYSQLILAAALPALLCYATLLVAVHIEALKLGLKGLPRNELPPLAGALRSGWYYMLPVVYLVFALAVLQITPERAALNTIFVMVGMIFVQEVWKAVRAKEQVTRGLRASVDMIVGSLETGARNMIGIAIATAAAGVIVGTVTVTGIGFGLADILGAASEIFRNFFLALGGALTFVGVDPASFANTGELILILFLAQIICLLLGMGLPTTANYIVMAALIVPVLLKLAGEAGYTVPPLAAHMFAFYFGIMADTTPPVALAAFAAAAISGGNPVKTGVQGFIYEMRTALLAYMIFFNPALLLIGVNSVGEGIWIALTAFVGLSAFSAGTLGFLHRRTNVLERVALIVAGLLLVPTNPVLDMVGAGLFLGVYLLQRARRTVAPPLRPL